MIQFSSDDEISKIPVLLQAFLQGVLYDEEPLFISDEATIWDVSTGPVEEILGRCSDFYGIPVSLEDSKQPLYRLLPWLDKARRIQL
jgi:hypothetical protein